MAHTNQTAHYHLPQYVGTDIINPLTDTNGAYEAIDTALYEQGQGIASVVDDIDALKIQNGDSALDTTAQTLSGAINELKNDEDALGLRVTANETNIGTLQTQMSTATGNITTLNTTVGGLQTEVASKASATALDNLTTKVGTGNLDTVAQNCVDAINEVKAAIPSGGGSASSVSYDGTTSGLSATNVQDAIDEVKADIPTSFSADDVTYDNTDSGLTATDVQSAINELNDAVADLKKYAIGTSVALTKNTDYTCPSDGYLKLTCTYSTGYRVLGYVNNVNMLTLASNASSPNTETAQIGSLFVKKGMTIKWDSTNNDNVSGEFIPIV